MTKEMEDQMATNAGKAYPSAGDTVRFVTAPSCVCDWDEDDEGNRIPDPVEAETGKPYRQRWLEENPTGVVRWVHDGAVFVIPCGRDYQPGTSGFETGVGMIARLDELEVIQ